MNTQFILAAQYGKAIVDLEMVRKDYFPSMTAPTFKRRIREGQINLPLVYLSDSQKSATGVPLADLADYLDERMEIARKEARRRA